MSSRPRSQYWALRSGLMWRESVTAKKGKVSDPFSLVYLVGVSAEDAEDPVLMVGFTPSPIDLPYHKRWGRTYEAVGLGPHCRKAKQAFSGLLKEAGAERDRRNAMKLTPFGILLEAKQRFEEEAKRVTRNLAASVESTPLHALLGQTWGGSVPGVLKAQFQSALLTSLVTDELSSKSDEEIVQRLRDEITAASQLSTSNYEGTQRALLRLYAGITHVEAAKELEQQIVARMEESRLAHKIQDEIDRFRNSYLETT